MKKIKAPSEAKNRKTEKNVPRCSGNLFITACRCLGRPYTVNEIRRLRQQCVEKEAKQ